MSNKYPGGLVTLNPPVQDPALGAATNGVWTMDQALNAETSRSWPMYDPYYNNVVLNLHGNGTNGAQNNTFLDSSSNNFTITRNGNTTQGAFNPYQQNGYWSNYFDGSSNIVGSLSSALGTGDFTVEFWVYIVSNSGTGGEGGFLQTTTSSTGLSTSEYGVSSLTMQRSSGTNTYGFTVGGTSVPFSNSGTYLNQWMHIACVRSSGTVRIYMNGVLNSTPTTATTNLTGTYIGIGGYYNGNYLCNAYITNFRATSTVVYSGNFTPPTSPLTAITGTLFLGCQSNRFLNTSSGAAMTVNTGTPSVQTFNPLLQNLPYESSRLGGSGYFDGSGDSLTTPSITVGTNAFCFECWFYPTTTQTAAAGLFVGTTNGSIQAAYYISPGLGLAERGVAWSLTETTAAPIVGQWNHIAFVRSSTSANQTSIFLNGVRVANGTVATNYVASTYNVGYNSSDAVYALGYFSDARLTVGSSPYAASSSTITIPTAPLTAVSGTSFLLSMTNAGIFDNATMNNLETVGNAQISTTQKKYGTASIAFDGASDYLVSNAATSNLCAFGGGDYTIEMWIYFNNVSTLAVFYDSRPTATNGIYPTLYVSGGSVYFYINSANEGSAAVSTGQWYHLAVCRSSGTVKMFLNGTQSATWADTRTYLNGSSRPVIGSSAFGSGDHFNGYIDDLRVTKGVARYLGTFTPPTSQLQDQ